MRFTVNLNKQETFQNQWNRYKQSGEKTASKPGPGWLQGEAGHRDLCTALFKDMGGNYVVCGNPVGVSSDPYMCQGCVDLLGKIDA